MSKNKLDTLKKYTPNLKLVQDQEPATESLVILEGVTLQASAIALLNDKDGLVSPYTKSLTKTLFQSTLQTQLNGGPPRTLEKGFNTDLFIDQAVAEHTFTVYGSLSSFNLQSHLQSQDLVRSVAGLDYKPCQMRVLNLNRIQLIVQVILEKFKTIREETECRLYLAIFGSMGFDVTTYVDDDEVNDMDRFHELVSDIIHILGGVYLQNKHQSAIQKRLDTLHVITSSQSSVVSTHAYASYQTALSRVTFEEAQITEATKQKNHLKAKYTDIAKALGANFAAHDLVDLFEKLQVMIDGEQSPSMIANEPDFRPKDSVIFMFLYWMRLTNLVTNSNDKQIPHKANVQQQKKGGFLQKVKNNSKTTSNKTKGYRKAGGMEIAALNNTMKTSLNNVLNQIVQVPGGDTEEDQEFNTIVKEQLTKISDSPTIYKALQNVKLTNKYTREYAKAMNSEGETDIFDGIPLPQRWSSAAQIIKETGSSEQDIDGPYRVDHNIKKFLNSLINMIDVYAPETFRIECQSLLNTLNITDTFERFYNKFKIQIKDWAWSECRKQGRALATLFVAMGGVQILYTDGLLPLSKLSGQEDLAWGIGMSYQHISPLVLVKLSQQKHQLGDDDDLPWISTTECVKTINMVTPAHQMTILNALNRVITHIDFHEQASQLLLKMSHQDHQMLMILVRESIKQPYRCTLEMFEKIWDYFMDQTPEDKRLLRQKHIAKNFPNLLEIEERELSYARRTKVSAIKVAKYIKDEIQEGDEGTWKTLLEQVAKIFKDHFIARHAYDCAYSNAIVTRIIREYKNKARRSIYLGAPTGEGKTFMFFLVAVWWLTCEADEGDKVLIVTHNPACLYQIQAEVNRVLKDQIVIAKRIAVVDGSTLSAVQVEEHAYKFVIIDEIDINLRQNLFIRSDKNLVKGLIHLLKIPFKLFVSATLPDNEKVHLIERWGMHVDASLDYIGQATITFGDCEPLPKCTQNVTNAHQKVAKIMGKKGIQYIFNLTNRSSYVDDLVKYVQIMANVTVITFKNQGASSFEVFQEHVQKNIDQVSNMPCGIVSFDSSYSQGFNCKPCGKNPKIMCFCDDQAILDSALIRQMAGRSNRDGAIVQLEILFVTPQPGNFFILPDPKELMSRKSKFAGDFRNTQFLYKGFAKMITDDLTLDSDTVWMEMFKKALDSWNTKNHFDFISDDDMVRAITALNHE